MDFQRLGSVIHKPLHLLRIEIGQPRAAEGADRAEPEGDKAGDHVHGAAEISALAHDAAGHKQQLVSALAWWAIGGAGFVGGWATGAYLIAAARERDFVYRLARGFLIALVFAAATAGGVMSKTGNLGGTVDVIAGLTALGLGLICAFCGARLAYLNAEQV